MSSSQPLLDQIKEANLTYLLLSQRLIQDDQAMAMVRLGIDDDVADILSKLTTQQIIRMSNHNSLLCSVRRQDLQFWAAHLNTTRQQATSEFHAAILLAEVCT